MKLALIVFLTGIIAIVGVYTLDSKLAEIQISIGDLEKRSAELERAEAVLFESFENAIEATELNRDRCFNLHERLQAVEVLAVY